MALLAPLSAKHIADLVGAESVLGDETRIVSCVSSLESATPESLVFVNKPHPAQDLSSCAAEVALVKPQPKDAEGGIAGKTLICVASPRKAFATIMRQTSLHSKYGYFAPQPGTISQQAFIDPSAQLAAGVTVFPYAFIGKGVRIGSGSTICSGVHIGTDSVIGEHCFFAPNAVIMHRIQIGNRVIVGANSVVGSDGFGFEIVPGDEGHARLPHLGQVVIEDDVELGACSTVDRAALDNTVIKRGTKVDNLVQIAHNCTIGAHNLVAAMSGFAGSSTTGEHVYMGGRSAVASVHVPAHTMLAGRSGVTSDIKTPGIYGGMPARPQREYAKAAITFYKASDTFKKQAQQIAQQAEQIAAQAEQIATLEDRLQRLEEQQQQDQK